MKALPAWLDAAKKRAILSGWYFGDGDLIIKSDAHVYGFIKITEPALAPRIRPGDVCVSVKGSQIPGNRIQWDASTCLGSEYENISFSVDAVEKDFEIFRHVWSPWAKEILQPIFIASVHKHLAGWLENKPTSFANGVLGSTPRRKLKGNPIFSKPLPLP